MARPARYDIPIKRREDCIVRLRLKDGLKEPINLIGFRVSAEVWDQARTVKHAEFEVTFVDRLDGRIDLRLYPEDTEKLPNDSWYDLLVIEPDGIQTYQLEGIIYCQEGYSGGL